MTNFFSDIIEGVKALRQLPDQIRQSSIAAEQANKVAAEARKKGVYNVDAPRTYNFFSDVINASKGAKNAAEALSNFQNFTESNKSYKPFGNPIEAKSTLGKVAALPVNLVQGWGNDVVGEGLNTISDTARNYVATRNGEQVPYDSLKSSAWKLKQNIEGINDTPTEVIGNIAGTILPIATVYSGGAPAKTAVSAVGNLAKKKLGKVMLEGAIGGAKMGATFGTLSALKENRESLKQQLTSGAIGAATGGVGGAVLGGAAAGLGYGLGEYKRAPDSVKRGGYVNPGADAGSFGDDAVKAAKANTKINVKNFKVADAKKQIITDAVEGIKPRVEKAVGKRLTNKEVANYAAQTSKTLENTIGRDQTKQWNAAMLNLRERIAKSAEDGRIDKQFIDDLLTVKTQSADIGRKLQSFNIQANPSEKSLRTSILSAILDVNKNTDDILKAAQGVDFNDLNQATNFYRQFIKPTAGEWLDLIRYNSMLSSPNTHVINAFSNFLNTTVIAPFEKTMTGGVDFLGSKIRGTPRKYYAGEGWQYAKGYFSNMKEATKKFSSVMSGKSGFTNLDVKSIPISSGKVVKTLSYPLRLLEAADQFFTTLGTNAEKTALQFRQSKGVSVPNIDILAAEDAAYRVFRQDLHSANQGHVLDAIDSLTGAIMKLRGSKNPFVSIPAKFTLPFVKTPMNIFKQGIEYSPIGFTTAIGAKNVEQQISKAILGTAVFAGASMMLASDRLTWAEPTNPKEKTLWRQAGKQAYSIKIGDTWFSYQKLPPAIAFPFAMVASLNDLKKNRMANDDAADLIMGYISKYGQFLADQSYAKSIGDLLDVAGGGVGSVSKFFGNYPQQLIPYRAFTGWLARLTDPTQRVTDARASFIEKQMQLFMQQYPGLSQLTPARLDEQGKPIENKNRAINAISPVRTSPSVKEFENFLKNYEDYKMDSRLSDERTQNAKDDFKAKYDLIKTTFETQGKDEAQKLVNQLTDEEYATFESLYRSERTKARNNAVIDIYPTVKQVRDLMSQGKKNDAQRIVNSLTDEEYKLFETAYKQTR